MSDIPRKDREELNALSKEIFGVSSKWQKFARGISELVTKTVKEVVPGDKGAPDTERNVTVPVLTLEGAKQYKIKVYSVEEIREMLLKYKVQRDQIIAEMNAAEALKKAQETVQKQAAGGTTAQR